MNLVIHSKFLPAYEKKVNAAIARIHGPRLRALVVSMADDIVAEYRRIQQTFTPGPVQDLNPDYKKAKARKHGKVYPILEATGQLMDSMAHVVRVRSAGADYSITVVFKGQHRTAGKFGIMNARLAEIHVTGEGKMPARNFMKLSRNFSSMWTKRILAELKGK